MAHLSQPRPSRTRVIVRRVVAELGREIPTVFITSPIVVPIWWAIWKLCDTAWTHK
jgi:hypothetical protein